MATHAAARWHDVSMNGVGLSDEHEHPVAPNPLAAAWSIASPQRLPVTGGADYPSVRYSASSIMYNGEMIITHGYFYDHGNHHPAWQSNAWAFNTKQQTWRKIHEGGQGLPDPLGKHRDRVL